MPAAEKISVIIVSYNAGTTISIAIESVLRQDYQNKELIIIDGDSNDNTKAILESFGGKINFWKSEPDKGIYDAMNKGIKASAGDWLLFLGADDFLCNNVLGSIFTNPGSDNIDVIYGKVKLMSSLKELGGPADAQSLIEENIPHQAIIYSRNVLNMFNGYDMRYPVLADYNLNISLFENPGIRKKFIDTPIAAFSSRGASYRTIDSHFFSEKLEYFISRHNLSRKDKRLAKYYFYTGVASVLRKEFKQGIPSLFRPLIYSNKRFYYFLLLADFLFSVVGLRKKYKVV